MRSSILRYIENVDIYKGGINEKANQIKKLLQSDRELTVPQLLKLQRALA